MRLSKQQLVSTYTSHIKMLLNSRSDLKPYFVTTVFRDHAGSGKQPFKQQAKFVEREYQRVYRHVTSQLMNNFAKKRHLHPLTFDFVDLPNSEKHGKLNLDSCNTPHIHSIYLVNDHTVSRYELLRQEAFQRVIRHPSMSSLASIHSEAIDVSDLWEVVGYSSKLLEHREAIQHADGAPLFYQFPIARFEQVQLRNDRRYDGLLAFANVFNA